MAVIRAGRSRLIKAGVIGAVAALVPAIITCVVLVLFIAKKDEKLDETRAELSKYKEGTVCILKNDMEIGQKIKEDNLMVVSGMFYENVAFVGPEEYIGMSMKTSAKTGTILNDCIVTEEVEDVNMRTYYVDYISIPDGISDGMKFDIRISFPNGEDYLVAKDKKISIRDEVGFYIDLNRREALLLSSAQVDCAIYTGSKIYVAFHTTGFEENEIPTYPVNSYVFELGQWEPNLKETFSEEMFSRREILEANLLDFMGITNNLE